MNYGGKQAFDMELKIQISDKVDKNKLAAGCKF